MPPRRGSKTSSVGDLLFITDIPLRNKIEDAIEMISLLYLLEKQGSFPRGFLKENRRMIILYSASVVEAVLLYVYKKKGFAIRKTNYLDVVTLPASYQLEPGSTLVVAKQVQGTRPDRELMLDILLKVCFDEGVIDAQLQARIEKAKNVRNTFHLSKSRKGLNCSPASANQSFEAVLDTIVQSREYLHKNP